MAAAAASSVVTISNVPLVPAVIVAVSLEEPVIVITLPFMATSSTVKAVRVPRLVIFVCAAVVTVAAVPDVLPVTLPVILPVNVEVTPVEVNIPVLGLYVKPVSVSIPCVPVAPSTKAG